MSNNTFSNEFLPYSDQLIKVMDLTLEKGRKKHEGVLNCLRGYYFLVNYLVDEKNVFNEMPQGFKTLLSKGALDLLGTYSTLSSGCMNQSLNLVRSLFESNIYLTYINRDFENLVSYYENYTHFMRYRKWQKGEGSLDFSQKQIETISTKYEAIKENYRDYGHWYDKPLVHDMKKHPAFSQQKRKKASFRAMCIILDQGDMYDKLYSTMSESVHGSSLVSTLFTNEKDNMSMAPRFNSFYIESLSTLCIIFLNNMVEIGLNRQIEKGNKDYIPYLDFTRKYIRELL